MKHLCTAALAALAVVAFGLPAARAGVVLDREDPFDTTLAYLLGNTNPDTEIFAINPSISGILAFIEIRVPSNQSSTPVTMSFSNDGTTYLGADTETIPTPSAIVTFTPLSTIPITAGELLYVKMTADDPTTGASIYGGISEPFTTYISGPITRPGYRQFVNTDVQVPEPSSLPMLGTLLLIFGWHQLKKQKIDRAG
jgi:hypothetical protein